METPPIGGRVPRTPKATTADQLVEDRRVSTLQLMLSESQNDVRALRRVAHEANSIRLLHFERVAQAAIADNVALRNSTSWKVTGPLRAGSRLLRKVVVVAKRASGRKDSTVANAVLAPRVPRSMNLMLGDESILETRLAAVAVRLGMAQGAVPNSGEAWVEFVASRARTEREWWLTHVAFVGSPPDRACLRRLVDLASVGDKDVAVAELRLRRARWLGHWSSTAPIEFVPGVVVDATFAASTALHTGVQRVVRSTTPRWVELGARLIVMDQDTGAWREPSAMERENILDWRNRTAEPELREPEPKAVLVPWDATVIVPELRHADDLQRLGCAAQAGVATFTAVVYDLIPLTAPEYVALSDSANQVQYIGMLKSFQRLCAISRSAGVEFSGFSSQLVPQGLPVPSVRTRPLPIAATPRGAQVTRGTRMPRAPYFLCVGSFAPHKNQMRLLRAADRLWSEGETFTLCFVAPNAWDGEELTVELQRMLAQGRSIEIRSKISEGELSALYSHAFATVLVSLIEGYGLPLSESLGVGVPVVSSKFGSMAEIVEPGGGLMVDPRSVDEISDALRRMLVEGGLRAELAAQAERRPKSTWVEYADAVWSWLVDGSEEHVDHA